MENSRYAVYIRVSSEQQVQEGDSIAMQESLARAIIQENKGELFKIYTDPGISASKTDLEDRPALMEMLNDAKDGLFDKLIVFKRDRLARNVGHAIYLRKNLQKYKVEIIFSAKGEVSAQANDPTGNFIEGQFALIAELEAAITSQRTTAVLQNKARNGEWIGGRPPYGYKRVDGMNIQIPEEIEVVKEVEELYISGLGEYAITKWLNGEEIKGMGKRVAGKVFRTVVNKPNELVPMSKDTVRNILTNPFYTGEIAYNKHDGKGHKKDHDEWIIGIGEHEPCRTMERHQQLLTIREDRTSKKKSPRFYTTEYLLTGLLFCKECGSKWVSLNTSRKGKQYGYYWCSSHKYPLKKCNTKSYPKELLETVVFNFVKEINQQIEADKELIEQELLNKKDQQNEFIKEEVKNLEIKIADLERRRKRNLELQEDATDDEIGELKQRQAEIRQSLEQAKTLKLNLEKVIAENNNNSNMNTQLLEALKDFSNQVDSMPYHAKKAILDSIISKMEINKDGVMDYVFKTPDFLNFVINNGESEFSQSPKNITLEYHYSIDEWVNDIYNKTKQNLPKVIIKFGQALLQDKFKSKFVTPTRLSKATGIPSYHYDNYLNNDKLPRMETAKMIADGFGLTLNDFVKELDVNVNPDVLFQLIGFKQSTV
jgi:DNA invertase Pin-like site-specific DNA recombinase